MPKAPLLDDDDVSARLAGMPAWARSSNRLRRTLRFSDFTEAVAFVDRLVEPANAQDHHPDVSIHWNEVTLTLWTHASGGLTERDFRLAETINRLIEKDP